jgi:hypothetical protein
MEPEAEVEHVYLTWNFAEGEVIGHFDAAHLIDFIEKKGGLQKLAESLDRQQFEHFVCQLYKEGAACLKNRLKLMLNEYIRELNQTDFFLHEGTLFRVYGMHDVSVYSLGLSIYDPVNRNTPLEEFFFMKWNENQIRHDRKCLIPEVSKYIAKLLPSKHNIPQDNMDHYFVKVALRKPDPPPHEKGFLEMLTDMTVAMKFERAHEGLAIVCEMLCRDEFQKNKLLFHAYGYLAQLLSLIGCSEEIVEGCLAKMFQVCRNEKNVLSVQLNCLLYQQACHCNLRNTKTASECHRIIYEALPICSDLVGASIRYHLISKLRRIEDFIMLCQTVRDFYWNVKPPVKIPDYLLDRLQIKLRKLKKTVHEWCGKGVKAEEALDLIQLYQVCCNKLRSPGSRPCFDGIELDSDIQFFLKFMTKNNYLISEYDVEMKENRDKVENQCHRSRTEESAHSLVTHSILWGVLSQNNEQQVKLLKSALDILEKADNLTRVPLLRQSLDAAIRDESHDRSKQVVRVLDLQQRIESTSTCIPDFNLPNILKMDQKIGSYIVFGRQSALKYYHVSINFFENLTSFRPTTFLNL